jgi:hypothetical protein
MSTTAENDIETWLTKECWALGRMTMLEIAAREPEVPWLLLRTKLYHGLGQGAQRE